MDQFTDRPKPTYITKYILKNLNKVLYSINNSSYSLSRMSIISAIHQFQPNYSITKNTLLFVNKFLKITNSYHVFRRQYILGLVGIGIGYGLSVLDDKYSQLLLYNKQKNKIINTLIQNHVLKNQNIQMMLNKILQNHVFPNQSIHYQLRQVILHAGIQPQMPKIQSLIKIASLNALRQGKNIDEISKAVIPAINHIQTPIIQFLRGTLFQQIVTDGIKIALKQQAVQNIIKNQIINTVRNNLKNQNNMENLYFVLKNKMLLIF